MLWAEEERVDDVRTMVVEEGTDVPFEYFAVRKEEVEGDILDLNIKPFKGCCFSDTSPGSAEGAVCFRFLSLLSFHTKRAKRDAMRRD